MRQLEKLRAPSTVNETVSRLVLGALQNEQGCQSTGENANMQAASNTKY